MKILPFLKEHQTKILIGVVIVFWALFFGKIIYMQFEDPTYAPGKLDVYFKENVTEEEALSIIESFNCTLNERHGMYRYENGRLLAHVEVPVGKEVEFRDKFRSHPAVLRCVLWWQEG